MNKGIIKNNNFTLVELLVVIVILAILMTLLLPSLSKARDFAKSVNCASNLKQQGTAIASYVNDYNGWLITSTYGSSSPENSCYIMRYQLCPYLGIDIGEADSSYYHPQARLGVFRCPSWFLSLSQPQFEGGYGWNYRVGYSDTSSGLPRQKITMLRRPSETVFMQDTIDWAPTSKLYLYYMALYPTAASTVSPPIGNRHRRGVETLWGDGHVSWNSQSELLQGKNGDLDYYYRFTKLGD